MPVGNVPELTKYVYGATPLITLANGLKLAIAEFRIADTVVVAPAVAIIGEILPTITWPPKLIPPPISIVII
jgi:hypothetical protein